jgi:hypothetical protein
MLNTGSAVVAVSDWLLLVGLLLLLISSWGSGLWLPPSTTLWPAARKHPAKDSRRADKRKKSDDYLLLLLINSWGSGL